MINNLDPKRAQGFIKSEIYTQVKQVPDYFYVTFKERIPCEYMLVLPADFSSSQNLNLSFQIPGERKKIKIENLKHHQTCQLRLESDFPITIKELTYHWQITAPEPNTPPVPDPFEFTYQVNYGTRKIEVDFTKTSGEGEILYAQIPHHVFVNTTEIDLLLNETQRLVIYDEQPIRDYSIQVGSKEIKLFHVQSEVLPDQVGQMDGWFYLNKQITDDLQVLVDDNQIPILQRRRFLYPSRNFRLKVKYQDRILIDKDIYVPIKGNMISVSEINFQNNQNKFVQFEFSHPSTVPVKIVYEIQDSSRNQEFRSVQINPGQKTFQLKFAKTYNPQQLRLRISKLESTKEIAWNRDWLQIDLK